MKTIITVPLALALALGMATAAHAGAGITASVSSSEFNTYRHTDYSTWSDHHRNGCVGLAAGTAHRSCGSQTGGPAGGLH